MTKRKTFCGSPEHLIDRRGFLTTAAAGTAAAMTALNVLQEPALAGELRKQQKRVILLWLAGGASQLETFDPKPGAATGGPLRALRTNVPGVAISQLMPQMGRRMNHACSNCSLITRDD